MKNKENKNRQDHTRSEGKYSNVNVYGNVEEPSLARSMEEATYTMEEMYMTMDELNNEAELTETMKRNEKPKTKKASSNKFTKTALVLLIILFLILIAITSFLLKYYLAMSDEMSRLKTHSDQQQLILEDVKTLKNNLDNVKENFLQDIKSINKTLETICRTCPSGWKTIDFFCYYFSSDDLSWDNARDECIRKGSTLIPLKTKEDLDALKSLLDKNRYWIGLRRDTEPGKWRWLDGSLLSFSNWKQGEPNNHKNSKEDCAESSYGKWNDLTCATTIKYVCKKGCWY